MSVTEKPRRVSLSTIEGPSPQAVFYQNHEAPVEVAARKNVQAEERRKAKGPGQGIVAGVILPSLQNIFGVILFLRLPWLVGLGGILETFWVVFVASLATGLTASSLSAIATNGKIGGGGNYYLISRSLGPALGASVGVCFFMANAFGTAMYLIGTVEAFELASPSNQIFPKGSTDNIRATGLIILAIALALNLAGLKYVTRVSIVFLVIMGLSIVCMYLGAFVGPWGPNSTPEFYGGTVVDLEGVERSITLEWGGLSAETCNANAMSSYDSKQLSYPSDNNKYDFFGLLSIWFPAVTGFEAGSNRSADLENPERDIPRGTFFAHILSSIIYISFPIIFGCLAPRSTLLDDKFFAASATWPAREVLIYGVIASTIGAGLTSLISGGRLLAAIANDKVLPILNIFAVKPGQEPRKALICVGCICAGAICIGELNSVAPILTMFFLMCYTCVNMSCVLLHVLKDPNWRPTFRFTHWTISLAGAILCIFIMFAISWWYAFIAIGFCSLIFVYASISATEGDWGDGLQSLKFQIIRSTLIRMSLAPHVKNWRINLLVSLPGHFSGNDSQTAPVMTLHDSELLKFVAQVSARSGIIWVTSIVSPKSPEQRAKTEIEFDQPVPVDAEPVPVDSLGDLSMLETLAQHKLLTTANAELSSKLKSFGIRGFSQVVCASNFKHSFLSATQMSGLGPIKPNCILCPYPANCLNDGPDGLQACSNLMCSIQSAVVCDKSMLIAMGQDWPNASERLRTSIDVWWFAASFAKNGGILMLIPFLLRLHPVWQHCEIRVFVISETGDVADTTMATTIDAYLKDIRIKAEVTTVPLERAEHVDTTVESLVRQTTLDSKISNPKKLSSLGSWVQLNVAGTKSCSQDIIDSAKVLNSTFMAESASADLVICNLPDPHPSQSARGYCQMLDALTGGLKRCIFVHEDTKDAITSDT